MNYFCRLDSSGDIDHTNLQLYSLKKASEVWNELLDDIADVGINGVEHLRERLTFILSCLGLSLSQLLRQNNPSPDKNKIDQPDKLLSNILNKANVERAEKRCLNVVFKDFSNYYEAVRHFGKNINDNKYEMVRSLNIREIDRFIKMTIQIWDKVISIYRQNSANEIDNDISSIADIVSFNQLPK